MKNNTAFTITKTMPYTLYISPLQDDIQIMLNDLNAEIRYYEDSDSYELFDSAGTGYGSQSLDKVFDQLSEQHDLL